MLKTGNNFFSRNRVLLAVAFVLLVLAFVINQLSGSNSGPKSVTKLIENQITSVQKAAEQFFFNDDLLGAIADNEISEKSLRDLVSKDFYIFLYKRNTNGTYSERFWSTQNTQPDSATIYQTKEEDFRKLPNGWFLSLTRNVDRSSGQFKFVCLIPVKWEYYIENKYLQNDFVGLPQNVKTYDINLQDTGLPIRDANGKIIFFLQKLTDTGIADVSKPAFILGIIALILILSFINNTANEIVKKFGLEKGALALFGSLLAIWVISFLVNPYNIRSLKLFQTAASDHTLFPLSLGDLFICSITFMWIVLFIKYHYRYRYSRFKTLNPTIKYSIAFFLSVAMAGVTFIVGDIIVNLVAEHQISFDVLNFFSLNIYSFIGFIVIACFATGYYFLIQSLLHPLRVLFPHSLAKHLMLTATAGLLILSLHPGQHITVKISMLGWLLLFIFLLELKSLLLHAYRLISSRFIFWTFFFSISITIVIIVQNRSKELEARKEFAETLSNKADPTGPVIMNIILTDFRSEYLSKVFYRFKDPMQSLLLKDSLLNESFSGYLNNYNTEIYTFDTLGTPLYNLRSTTFNDLNAIIQTQGRETDVPGLYYFDVSYSSFNYITKRTIFNSDGEKEGYIFIVSKPKQFKSEVMLPELFSRGNRNALESSSEYAFAVYNDGKLTSSYNDYPFSIQVSNNKFSHNGFQTIHNNGYEELWYQPQPGKLIVITRQDRFLLELVTLFAYLFCSFLLVTMFFNIAGRFISDNPARKKESPFWELSIRNQVHGTVILISIFSFVVIGISTILFFINRYHNNNREFLSRTIHVMENELHTALDSTTTETIKTKSLEQVPKPKLIQIINNVSNIHATDINLYNLSGSLEVSSLPLPYEQGILSNKMDPIAWYHMNTLKESQYFQEQKIGTLPYLSNYIPVRRNDGKPFAYLSIPLFESQKNLQDEISNFMIATINLNAFIFLIAGIIALFIANRITRSFSFISNKMKKINLQTGNEEIEWHRKDEIGDLVEEYNKMVRQLEKSADKLAKSEREGAWQEMARQVAHEIKNPLTPMKLNLQYLQMAIERNSPDVKNITLYVAGIILEQIDHLSKIASDFSQFAQIGNIHPELFDLNGTLSNVVSLYATNEKVDIKATYDCKLMINADKTQMNRLFTNLLQNAVQSVPDFRNIKIEIISKRQGDNAVISVRDNGIGIPVSMQSKIFTPNFTTKSSGTGLGLAMCKRIVQKVNGDITFETEENEWTVFYVTIPLVNTDNAAINNTEIDADRNKPEAGDEPQE